MAFLLEILASLALLHFVWEGILAPSIRLRLRYKLFSLRDQLRLLKMRKEVEDEELVCLQSAINTTIHVLARFDLASLSRSARAIDREPLLKKRVEKRMAVIRECDSKTYQEIYEELLTTARHAVAVNNGFWFLYLFPFLVAALGIRTVTRFITELISVPEGELSRVLPFDLPAGRRFAACG